VLSRDFPKGHPLPVWPLFDTNFKMNPPLRSHHDREELINGLADGTIEIIGSDHAPHSDYEKEVEFDYAPFGITGLETELSLALTQLYHTGRLTLPKLLEKFTVNPARLLRIEKGTLDLGGDGDITIFDPDRKWVYQREATASKSINCPFHGWPMRGKALATIVGGRIAWRESKE
jgi:dihydroorotase